MHDVWYDYNVVPRLWECSLISATTYTAMINELMNSSQYAQKKENFCDQIKEDAH